MYRLIGSRPVDFRCGHQALALMVQTELKLDPHSGVTVIFRSKRGDRLKILVWDGTGMVLTYKILEQGPAASLGRGAYSGMGQGKFRSIGTGRGHRHLDATDRDADLRPIFRSFRRIVPQVASASRVWARPRRRSAQIST